MNHRILLATAVTWEMSGISAGERIPRIVIVVACAPCAEVLKSEDTPVVECFLKKHREQPQARD